jgi:hypothetical protein
MLARATRLASRSRQKSGLRVEPLEDRCLPSLALPVDLGAGLDGDAR